MMAMAPLQIEEGQVVVAVVRKGLNRAGGAIAAFIVFDKEVFFGGGFLC